MNAYKAICNHRELTLRADSPRDAAVQAVKRKFGPNAFVGATEGRDGSWRIFVTFKDEGVEGSLTWVQEERNL